MLEKIGQSAETLVSRVNVSRRGFLGRLGHGAALLGGTLGGVLLMTGRAEAGRLHCPKGQTAYFVCCTDEGCFDPVHNNCPKGAFKEWYCGPK